MHPISTKKPPKELIVSPAIVLNKNRLFTGESYEDCMNKIRRFITDEVIQSTEEGFLSSNGDFLNPYEAGKVALIARQIWQYTPALKPEDIFAIHL